MAWYGQPQMPGWYMGRRCPAPRQPFVPFPQPINYNHFGMYALPWNFGTTTPGVRFPYQTPTFRRMMTYNDAAISRNTDYVPSNGFRFFPRDVSTVTIHLEEEDESSDETREESAVVETVGDSDTSESDIPKSDKVALPVERSVKTPESAVQGQETAGVNPNEIQNTAEEQHNYLDCYVALTPLPNSKLIPTSNKGDEETSLSKDGKIGTKGPYRIVQSSFWGKMKIVANSHQEQNGTSVKCNARRNDQSNDADLPVVPKRARIIALQ